MASILPLLAWLQAQPPFLLMGMEWVCTVGFILLFFRVFQAAGLSVYICITVLLANIQVLKAVQMPWAEHPVVLGTILFNSTLFASDILTEFFGVRAAKRALWMGFVAVLMVSLLMLLTIGMQPLMVTPEYADPDGFIKSHLAIETLFLPMPVMLIASLIAYVVSQYSDILLYQALKIRSHGKWLGMRVVVSSMVAILLDTIIFSVLAWVVLPEEPVSWTTLWHSYIVGTIGIRFAAAMLSMPAIYLARRIATW
jgi:uncharacterized integral membrane protein (TIGR00697 family)